MKEKSFEDHYICRNHIQVWNPQTENSWFQGKYYWKYLGCLFTLLFIIHLHLAMIGLLGFFDLRLWGDSDTLSFW